MGSVGEGRAVDTTFEQSRGKRGGRGADRGGRCGAMSGEHGNAVFAGDNIRNTCLVWTPDNYGPVTFSLDCVVTHCKGKKIKSEKQLQKQRRKTQAETKGLGRNHGETDNRREMGTRANVSYLCLVAIFRTSQGHT